MEKGEGVKGEIEDGGRGGGRREARGRGEYPLH